ncbi:aldo-keto reductase family 1 member A1-B [Nasonia vitripennis]|uniref:NADP-dependent oxidoreductase domain-containing protein n=1 Tax=Nasonia vitripennis TaxID=7425 RepID=A0A7M7G3Z9_NASVI|nr:aldo-keto reductase family 1 member A1-B [Nasonia vitripennis]
MRAFLGIVCLVVLAVVLPGAQAVEKLKLSSGHEIPAVGLGTSTIKLDEMDNAISSALENGYRHIDTAFSYDNEAAIGKILKKWFDKGGKREDIFITSKLPSQGNRPQSVETYLKRSLKDLGLDYVDMYLIHTPFAVKEGENLSSKQDKDGNDLFDDVDHKALWKAMERQVKEGRAKSIGLSNFNQSQVLNIYNNAEIKPSNLQVETHAYLQQKQLRKFCKEHNIVMTAYAPLGSHNARLNLHRGTPKELPALVELPLIKSLAAKYNKSPGQILLRHTIQEGLVAIPKSSNAQRQKSNIDIFDFKLTDEEMKKIDALDKGEKGRVFDFLAFYKDLDKNPEYPWHGQ